MIGPSVEVLGSDPAIHHQRYLEYRKEQGRALVFMLPSEAVRPMLRRLLARPEWTHSVSDDPLGALAAYCSELLPLPPFDVWFSDVRANPDAYVDSLAVPSSAPTIAAPVTLEVRRFQDANVRWSATLQVFRDAGAWRGIIVFRSEHREAVYRTSAVFCEERPRQVRDRFRSFGPEDLKSFLRSSMVS